MLELRGFGQHRIGPVDVDDTMAITELLHKTRQPGRYYGLCRGEVLIHLDRHDVPHGGHVICCKEANVGNREIRWDFGIGPEIDDFDSISELARLGNLQQFIPRISFPYYEESDSFVAPFPARKLVG